jgi:Ca2+-binding EF-hand superfamily protein
MQTRKLLSTNVRNAAGLLKSYCKDNNGNLNLQEFQQLCEQ